MAKSSYNFKSCSRLLPAPNRILFFVATQKESLSRAIHRQPQAPSVRQKRTETRQRPATLEFRMAPGGPRSSPHALRARQKISESIITIFINDRIQPIVEKSTIIPRACAKQNIITIANTCREADSITTEIHPENDSARNARTDSSTFSVFSESDRSKPFNGIRIDKPENYH